MVGEEEKRSEDEPLQLVCVGFLCNQWKFLKPLVTWQWMYWNSEVDTSDGSFYAMCTNSLKRTFKPWLEIILSSSISWKSGRSVIYLFDLLTLHRWSSSCMLGKCFSIVLSLQPLGSHSSCFGILFFTYLRQGLIK